MECRKCGKKINKVAKKGPYCNYKFNNETSVKYCKKLWNGIKEILG